MLQSFRNASKSWIVKLLLGLLVLSFGVWGIKDVATGGGIKDLATVGNQTVSGYQYTQGLNRAIDNFSKQSGSKLSLEDARKFGIDKQVRDGLIASAALDSMASDMGVSFGNAQITQETTSNPMFQDGAGKFDVDVFRRLLANNSLSEESYLAGERQNKVRRALTSVSTNDLPPKTLIDAQLQYRDETRQARYFSFSVSDKDVPAATDADIKKYFDEHAGNYVDPEYRSLAIMKVEAQDIAGKLDVNEQELKDGYEKLKADYFQPEKRSLLQLAFPDEAAAIKAKQRLTSGEDFMKIATELGAKETDITLADKTKSDLFDPAIAEAAFSLAQGGVSEPVKGGLATVLLKVTSVQPEKQSTLAEIKDQLKSRLQVDKAKDELQTVFDAVEDARAGQTKFEEIAAKAGIPLTLVPTVSAAGKDRKGTDVVVPGGDELLKAAFSSDVGVENDAVNLPEGYVWYEVREVVPSAPQKLETVKPIVIADWKAGQLRAASEAKAKKLVERVKSGTPLADIAKELDVAVKETKLMKRNDALEDFDSTSVAAMFLQPEKSVTYALEGDGVSAKLIQISKVALPAAAADTVDIKQLNDETQAALTRDLTETYLAAVRSGTKVTINEELWRQIGGGTAEQ
jgi:peptidyl-prolyl cis-trans isomerase D